MLRLIYIVVWNGWGTRLTGGHPLFHGEYLPTEISRVAAAGKGFSPSLQNEHTTYVLSYNGTIRDGGSTFGSSSSDGYNIKK